MAVNLKGCFAFAQIHQYPGSILQTTQVSDMVVMVVGQDKKYLAALIRPDLHVLSKHLLERELHSISVLNEPHVEYLIREEITRRINEAKDFKPFEKIVKFKLVEEDWNREHGLLTPTLKLKRNVITERYRDLIIAVAHALFMC